ncbi:MAG: sulfite exporter TauE/SafE family protein [Planctomycetes bacterium]|nr:sulfite exporter TauE/SafE family protein [Planctomycetota bacterium]
MWITIVGVSVLVTAFISGVFGMVGGLILMAIYLALLSVPEAMLLHGVTQLASNGSRAFLLRDHFHWPGIRMYVVGATVGVIVFASLAISLDKATCSIALGSIPWLALMIPSRMRQWLDFTRASHAVSCGFLVTGAHLTAGVSGPLLDVFFVGGSLSRHQIVGTKALTQSIAHTTKIIYFTALAPRAANWSDLPPYVYLVVIAMALVGTRLGRAVLDRWSDRRFLQVTRWLVLAIGAVSIVRGISTWGA